MRSSVYAASFFVMLILAHPASAGAQLKGLILTSPGIYHDYAYQAQAISAAVASRVNIQFDISLEEIERWKNTDFGEGYDIIVYNICMADNTDTQLIANLRRQTEVLGIPAMVVHCTMHSFRNTEDWWPLYGLKTVAHEALDAMPLRHAAKHPILAGIPKDWVVARDELYINLTFTADPLLNSPGEDETANVAAWTRNIKGSRIFGTTLGHSLETIEDPIYQRLLTNGLLWATDNLQYDGTPGPGLEPDASNTPIVQISKAEGVDFLSEDTRSCMRLEMGKAVGPCYAACILHPFSWGEQARTCKETCNAKLPPANALILACSG